MEGKSVGKENNRHGGEDEIKNEKSVRESGKDYQEASEGTEHDEPSASTLYYQ